MRVPPPFILAGLAAILPGGPAASQTSNYRSLEVTGGQVTRLAVVTALKRDCTPGEIGGVRVVTAPKNGNLQLKRATIKTSARYRCPNASTTAEAVFYIPQSGFAGQDELSYDLKDADGAIERFNIKINVLIKTAPPVQPRPSTPRNDKSEGLDL